MDYLVIYFIIGSLYAHQSYGTPDWQDYEYLLPNNHEVIHHVGYIGDNHIMAAPDKPNLDNPSRYNYNSDHLYTYHVSIPIDHGHVEIKSYDGPIATPVVLPDGHLADTPEVTLAKIHHLAAVAQAKADKYYSGHAEHGYGGAYGYSGSHNGYGIPVVLPNGHIADTHEVAAAKSAHLLAVAKAKADKYYSGKGEYYGYGGGYSGSHKGYGIPVVLPNGHVADAHEVAAAKSDHMTAVALAKAEQSYSQFYNKDNDHADYEDHQYVPDQDSYYDENLYSHDGPHGEYIDIPHHDLSYLLNYHSHDGAHHEYDNTPKHDLIHNSYYQSTSKAHHQSKDEPLGSGNFWFFG